MQIRQGMIEVYTQKLCASLGGVYPPINPEKLKKLYEEKKFVEIAHYIQTNLRINLQLRIKFENFRGPDNAPAWIGIPELMPLYGSRTFNQLILTIHVWKSFLKNPFEAIIRSFAHELCHIILRALSHELQYKEEAVDLAAMIFGYRNFFRTGSQYKEIIKQEKNGPFFKKIIDFLSGNSKKQKNVIRTHTFGYLTLDEINFAADIMDRLYDKNK